MATLKNPNTNQKEYQSRPMERRGKFKMEKITHYPTISLTEEEKTRLNKRLPKLLDIADHHCMISNSIRNNVKIEIQATIQDEN